MRLLSLFSALCLLCPLHAPAYSVHTHEQIIDLSWKSTIAPFILRQFPRTTPAELERAHSYAYGGCAIQDLGYYPFGRQIFSDLTHYVRSADFIDNLFRHATNADELAFAAGALSHYLGDSIGHKMAVNPAVAIEFPKLADKYGSSVAYYRDPHAHVRTEFAFDVNEVSKHRMAPSAYLRHVGLRVPTRLLARAFFDTYGLDFVSVIGKRRPVIRGYRSAVRSFLPRITYAEALLHRDDFPADQQTPAFAVFEHNLASADFEKRWESRRKQAGIKTHLLMYLIVILPKIGPLSMLAIRGPHPETHQAYIQSVNNVTETLHDLLADGQIASHPLPNIDLDTGERVRPGGYILTDRTYAQLLDQITKVPRHKIPASLKQDILDYYESDPQAPISTKRSTSKWARVEKQLATLRTMDVVPEPDTNDTLSLRPFGSN